MPAPKQQLEESDFSATTSREAEAQIRVYKNRRLAQRYERWSGAIPKGETERCSVRLRNWIQISRSSF